MLLFQNHAHTNETKKTKLKQLVSEFAPYGLIDLPICHSSHTKSMTGSVAVCIIYEYKTTQPITLLWGLSFSQVLALPLDSPEPLT